MSNQIEQETFHSWAVNLPELEQRIQNFMTTWHIKLFADFLKKKGDSPRRDSTYRQTSQKLKMQK